MEIYYWPGAAYHTPEIAFRDESSETTLRCVGLEAGPRTTTIPESQLTTDGYIQLVEVSVTSDLPGDE